MERVEPSVLAAPCLLELGREESSISDAQTQIESIPSIQAPLLLTCVSPWAHAAQRSQYHPLIGCCHLLGARPHTRYWGFIRGRNKQKSVPSWGR